MRALNYTESSKFSAITHSVFSLLRSGDEDGHFFIISPPQRRYKWGSKEQVRDFVDDLWGRHITDSTYYLGPLMLLEDDNTLIVFDGQQRLTSAMLLISVLRKEAASLEKARKQLDDDRYPQSLIYNQYELYSLLTPINTSDNTPRFRPPKWRLELQQTAYDDKTHSDANAFSRTLESASKGEDVAFEGSRIYDAYNEINDRIQERIYGKYIGKEQAKDEFLKQQAVDNTEGFMEFCKDFKKFSEYFVSQVKFQPIIFEDKQQARTAFDTSNTRGKKLTADEALKAALTLDIRTMNPEQISDFYDSWGRTTDFITSKLLDDGSMAKYLRVVWQSATGIFPGPKEVSFINAVKSYAAIGENDSSTYSAHNLAEDLDKFKDSYILLHKPSEQGIEDRLHYQYTGWNQNKINTVKREIMFYLKHLNVMGYIDPYPYLLAVLQNHPKHFLQVLRLTLAYQMRNVTLNASPNHSRPREKEWTRDAFKVNKCGEEGLRLTFDNLQGICATYIEFETAFKKQAWEQNPKAKSVAELLYHAIYPNSSIVIAPKSEPEHILSLIHI